MTDANVTSEFRSPLDKWLWKNRRTGKSLAEELGVHEATISRIRGGDKSEAGAALLEEIKKATGLKTL